MSNRVRFEQAQRMRAFGRLMPLEGMVPQATTLSYANFGGGLDMRDVRHGTPEGSTPFALDTDVSEEDRVRRIHGISTVEIWSELLYPELDVRQVAGHSSLDYRTELLLFAPPYLGVKNEGTTVWHSLGLTTKAPYGWVNHGGTMLFSNMDEGVVWKREPGMPAEQTDKVPAALIYASFAGRVILGYGVMSGNVERMGVRWSAANGDPEDWEGIGEGFELLIDDMSVGDKMVAMHSMGLDFLAVLGRNSVWLGRRTGLVDRPVDLRPVTPKVGALAQEATCVTQMGVAFLHDSGVHLLGQDGAVHLLSEPIEAELLPVDYTQLAKYKMGYNPRTKWLYLVTPTETWVLDMQAGRWWKMSLKNVAGMAMWGQQFEGLIWDEPYEGEWEEEEGSWDDASPPQGDDLDMWFVGQRSNGSWALGKRQQGLTCYFGISQTPYYQLPLLQQQTMDRLFTTQGVVLEYVGNGLLGLRQPNMDGDYVGTAAYDLPAAERDRVAQLPYVHTGLGQGIQLDLGTGCVEISKVELVTLPRSGRVIGTPQARFAAADYGHLSTLPGES